MVGQTFLPAHAFPTKGGQARMPVLLSLGLRKIWITVPAIMLTAIADLPSFVITL
jgi:hypothetical protein